MPIGRLEGLATRPHGLARTPLWLARGMRCGLLVHWTLPPASRLQPDFVVDGLPQALLKAQVSLRRLDRDVAEQKLDLVEFAVTPASVCRTGFRIRRTRWAGTLIRTLKPLLSSEMCGTRHVCCAIQYTPSLAVATLYGCGRKLPDRRCYASITPYEMCVRLG
jgi:hypothetical protein